MQLSGQQSFDVPESVVWETVFEPDILQQCIPGAKTVEKRSETAFEGEVQRGLASITVTMQITVEVVDDNRPSEVTVEISGTDNRMNSDVSGEALIQLEQRDGGGSELSYEANLNFTGRLVSLGSRMIKRQMSKDLAIFFSQLEEQIDAQSATPEK